MTKRNRWYEKNPMQEEALAAWEKFPKPLQMALAKRINLLVDKKRIPMRAVQSTTSEGAKFYQNFQKTPTDTYRRRRWYDRNETTRTAVNNLSLAHHSSNVFVAEKILELQAYVNSPGVMARRMETEADYENLLNMVLSTDIYAQIATKSIRYV